MLRFLSQIRNFCDLLLFFLKWPVCIALFALIIPTLQSAYLYYDKVFTNYHELLMFGIGFAFMFLIWIFLIGRKDNVVATMEHEMTHSLFALLTFHNVTDVQASMEGGGRMSFMGRGNWLITIAPYFFPTLSVGIIFIAIITYLISGEVVSWMNLALGLSTCYHVLAVLFELHAEQTDLKKVGWPFSFMFIPAANLLVYALVFAFVDKGLSGITDFINILYNVAMADITRIIS